MPVLLSLGLLAAALWVGLQRHTDPKIRIGLAAEKLRILKARDVGSLSLDEAEDGAVIARQLGDAQGEAKFRRVVAGLRSERSPL